MEFRHGARGMITLRPHQVAAADAVETAFRLGMSAPLVDACVASGKSLMMAEVARRAVLRGERVIIGAHTRELVEQNAGACRALGVEVGVNAAALGARTWRAPVISAAIQSIFRNARNFGPIDRLLIDEAHLVPHSEAGMYRALRRDLGSPPIAGFSGTVFRLQGGSLIEGEGAPFEGVVFQYSILDGIRDGYLCPAVSYGAEDAIDESKLRTRQGEFTAQSSDAQMLSLMDSHIAQMQYFGADRRSWLIFEASIKSAYAMTQRLQEWGVAAGVVLGETPAAERVALIQAFREGRLRALVNVAALTTGFDVPHVDLLVMRRPTQSKGLYIQMTGRALRCVGGNIAASIAAGKADCGVLDFAANIERHGPLNCIEPSNKKLKLVSCEECGKRNHPSAMQCWACDEPLTKNCPSCLTPVLKGVMDCPHCGYDMRAEARGGEVRPVLSKVPSGAELIASHKTGTERTGGWLPIAKVYAGPGGAVAVCGAGMVELRDKLAEYAPEARWLRIGPDNQAESLLLPNGASRSSARQVLPNGATLIVPLPAAA
jgi:DNA repair protein RadD